MHYTQNLQNLVVLKQQSATNGATLTSDQIDTLGFDVVKVTVITTTADNATNTLSTLVVQESDTTAATDFANVVAFNGGTATSATVGFVIPNMPTATTTAPFAVLNVNTAYRKRYLRVRVTPVTTQTFCVLAQLARAEQTPSGTASTQENAAVIVTG